MKNLIQKIMQVSYSIYAYWLQQTNMPKLKPSASLLFSLTSIISARTKNSMSSYWPRQPLFGENITKAGLTLSSYIPSLNAIQCAKAASALINGCKTASVDLTFIVSAMYQESRWTPAFNHNLSESNGVITFDGTDWGPGQFSGVQAKAWPEFKGYTEAQIQTKLMDPLYAIPRFISVYKQKLAEAVKLVNGPVVLQMHALPSWCLAPTNNLAELQQWYATVAYNAGDTGVKQILASGGYKTHKNSSGSIIQVAEHHGHNIQTWMTQFRPILEAHVTN